MSFLLNVVKKDMDFMKRVFTPTKLRIIDAHELKLKEISQNIEVL